MMGTFRPPACGTFPAMTVRWRSICLVCLLLVPSACGYHLVGTVSTLPEELETIYVERFENLSRWADIDQRLSIYRRLAKMDDLKEIAAMKPELADRFGPLPEETENLLLKIMLFFIYGTGRSGVNL